MENMVADFEVLYYNLYGGTEGIHEEPHHRFSTLLQNMPSGKSNKTKRDWN
jgi:hypothetical protein